METQVRTVNPGTVNLPEKKWLVVYTRPRWEKRVDQILKQQGIESYCPLRQVTNQWADRKKVVEFPLFVSYVFVRVNLREQAQVLYVLGVLNYVYYMGKPAVIRDCIIDQLKINLAEHKDVEVIGMQNLAIGDRARIREGLFNNQCGKIVQLQGRNVLMLLDSINCAIVTRVPVKNIVVQDLLQSNEN